MLVLTRKANETILIGDDIKITLVRVKGNAVRIGIEAPDDISILRGELDVCGKSADEAGEQAAVDPESAVFAHPVLKAAPSANRVSDATIRHARHRQVFSARMKYPTVGIPASDEGKAPLAGFTRAR